MIGQKNKVGRDGQEDENQGNFRDQERKRKYEDDTFLGVKNGVVKGFGTYSKPDYGFILDSNNNEYFCHYVDIIGTGFKNLAKGQHVKFKAYEGKKGLVAREVQLIVTGGDPYAEED